MQARTHDDDVNAVAFADESSHVFFSGSDDNTIKVCLVGIIIFASDMATGVGPPNAGGCPPTCRWSLHWPRPWHHTSRCQGIASCLSYLALTCPQRDGLHLISQGKDSAIKLWDIRKARLHM